MLIRKKCWLETKEYKQKHQPHANVWGFVCTPHEMVVLFGKFRDFTFFSQCRIIIV